MRGHEVNAYLIIGFMLDETWNISHNSPSWTAIFSIRMNDSFTYFPVFFLCNILKYCSIHVALCFVFQLDVSFVVFDIDFSSGKTINSMHRRAQSNKYILPLHSNRYNEFIRLKVSPISHNKRILAHNRSKTFKLTVCSDGNVRCYVLGAVWNQQKIFDPEYYSDRIAIKTNSSF